ncbi:MAG: DUF1015 domain-containing protein [Acidobacteria bacterium]|nr:DUF1015 domain-containing protein [Acidobacteriota bacterium]
MACIAPFRALRYDPSRVNPSKAITQPYDKITPEMQERYYAASPHNIVRIILGKVAANEPEGKVYQRAADFFRTWRAEGIFRQDQEPSLYSYSQRFTLPGGTAPLERRGFIALGHIEDYSAGIIFRHEQTLAKPKADRLQLLRSTQAHFGQIFMLYSDSGEIESLLATEAAPDTEVVDEYEVLHQVWKISEPTTIAAVRRKMEDKKLIIADGHHRYETALAYRNECRMARERDFTPARWHAASTASRLLEQGEEAPYEWGMMTFVNINSPGLVILPTHRVVHGLASFSITNFLNQARDYFSAEELDGRVDAGGALSLLQQANGSGTRLVAVMRERDILLHTPHAGAELFEGLSKRQQALDIVQLHRVVLEHILGLSEESIRNQQNIRYVRDAAEAVQRVRDGLADVAFLMNPVGIGQLSDIAFQGEVLPQKSTDFYPKLLTGLAMYALT